MRGVRTERLLLLLVHVSNWWHGCNIYDNADLLARRRSVGVAQHSRSDDDQSFLAARTAAFRRPFLSHRLQQSLELLWVNSRNVMAILATSSRRVIRVWNVEFGHGCGNNSFLRNMCSSGWVENS